MFRCHEAELREQLQNSALYRPGSSKRGDPSHHVPFYAIPAMAGDGGHSREVNPVPKGTSGVMTENAGTIESSDKTVTLVAPSTRTRAKTLTKAPEQCKLLAVSVGGCILAR